MTIPFHQYASVPVRGPTATVHDRLMHDPQGTVAAATAAALSAVEPFVRTWGLPPTALPTVTAEPTRPETFGAVDVRWDGEENSTAWPAMAVRLLVTPEDDGRATRLILLSRRPPGAELVTERIGRVHRRRIVEVATQRFLRELADIVSEPGPLHTQAASVTRFDRGATYVHHVRHTPTDPDELADRLTRDATTVAETVTAAAVDAAAPVLVAGGFRAPADPTVWTQHAAPGELGVLQLHWESDEEATGWPAITLALVVEAAAEGSHLSVVSPRAPGYDLSTNQMDKHQRDQILRELGGHVVDAIVRQFLRVSVGPAVISTDRPRVGTR